MYDVIKQQLNQINLTQPCAMKQKIPLGVSLLVWTVILHNLNSWCKNGPIYTVLMVTWIRTDSGVSKIVLKSCPTAGYIMNKNTQGILSPVNL